MNIRIFIVVLQPKLRVFVYKMDIRKGIFMRTDLLVGDDVMNRIADAHVIIFGVGGVGSWCAESLIRSGIQHLTMVDSDRVAITNINRQLMATTKTVGEIKVEVLKSRLLDINPTAEIIARQEIYSAETSDSFELDKYDYIIDAIDSLENKAHLIRTATKTKAVFVSSMGAALKMDPTKISVAEFWKVKGCPLAAALRRKMKKGERPAKKFYCVYSEEVLNNKNNDYSLDSERQLSADNKKVEDKPELIGLDWNSKKAQINGTVPHITAIFGFTLAGLVIQDINNKVNNIKK